jgi:hypothetical protein
VSLAAGQFTRISISGSLEILSILTMNGSFVLEVGSQGLNADIEATLRVFGVSFDVEAGAVISSGGLAFRAQVSLATASSFIPFNNFRISGTLMLEVNTRSSSASVSSVTIPGQTARISVLNAELNIFGFKARGSVIISAGANGFRIEIPILNPLTVSIAFFDASLHGWVSDDGFSFTGGVSFEKGSTVFVRGSGSITLASNPFLIDISVSASAGISIKGHRGQ